MNIRRSTVANNFVLRGSVARKSSVFDFLPLVMLFAFLVLVFVGFEPFSSRSSLETRAIATGSGDIARQLSYSFMFVVCLVLAVAKFNTKIIKVIPASVLVVLVWCLISVSWSIDPEVAFRRVMLTIIIVCTTMLSVEMVGVKSSLRILYLVSAAILIVNFVSLLFIAQARHLPGEFDPSLVGDWRGLFFHKNIAGPFSALSALLFFHFASLRHKWSDWLLFVAAVVFTIGTHSKTAIGFLAISFVAALFYRKSFRTDGGKRLFIICCAVVIFLAFIIALVAHEQIVDTIESPRAFTGRGEIWKIVIAYVRERPILGAGFGSFWQVGSVSPALTLSADTWTATVAHSHNGYLESLVTIGAVGLILAVIAFVIIPAKKLLSAGQSNVALNSLLFSIFVFVSLSNIFETISLNRDRPEWVVFLIGLALLHRIPNERTVIFRPMMKMRRVG